MLKPEMKYLPISKINTVVYCQRRYYIEVVLVDTISNYHIIEGTALHERSKRPGDNIWVWHDDLEIHGIIDQVKIENDNIVITEFKKGYLADHLSNQVQLCAQAICYEYSFSTELEYGYIYYHKTRRKQKIEFSQNLRNKVVNAIATMRALENHETFPPIVENTNKCRGCSVKETCQPKLASLKNLKWKPKEI